jgi:hypothetical protein
MTWTKYLLMPIVFCLSIQSAIANPWKTWTMVTIEDEDGQRNEMMEKRLAGALNHFGCIVEESGPLKLEGQVIITDDARVDGLSGTMHMLEGEITLSLVYTETGSTLGSETFTSKGGERGLDKARRELYKNFKFSKKKLSGLLDNAQVLLQEKLDAMNAALLDTAQQLYNAGQKDDALMILASVSPSAACYPDAIQLSDKIKQEQWQAYLTRLEHEQEMAAIQLVRDSLVADSLRQEKELAAAETAQRRAAADSARAVADALRDSVRLAETRRSEKLDQFKHELEMAEVGVKEIDAQARLTEAKTDSLIAAHREAIETYENTDSWTEELIAVSGNPKSIRDDVLMQIVAGEPGKEECKRLEGRWSSEKYGLTLAAHGKFVMTSEYKPKRIEGQYTVAPGNLITLVPDDSEWPAQQVEYAFEGTETLVLSGTNGFRVRFQRL